MSLLSLEGTLPDTASIYLVEWKQGEINHTVLAGAWPHLSWDVCQHLSRLMSSATRVLLWGVTRERASWAVFSFPSGYNGFPVISNRCGQAINQLKR